MSLMELIRLFTTAEEFADDELFGPEPVQLALLPVRRYWGACTVCDLVDQLVMGEPPICPLCRGDLARSRAHIATLRAATCRRLAEATHDGEQALLERRMARFDRADEALDELMGVL